jgi:hypothetical protein
LIEKNAVIGNNINMIELPWEVGSKILKFTKRRKSYRKNHRGPN